MLIQKIDETDGQEYLGNISESELDSSLQEKVNSLPTGANNNTVRFNIDGNLVETEAIKITTSIYRDDVYTTVTLNCQQLVNLFKGIVIKQSTAGGNYITLSDTNSELYIKKSATTGSYTLEIDTNGGETTEGTILVRQSDGKFKFKNISNYLGSSTGVKVLKLPFNKTTLNESTLSFPVGTRLIRMSVKVTTALTGSLSAISLQGSSPLTIASEFADYLQGVGTYNINLIDLPELDSTLAGKLRLSQPGSGTGAGVIYLEYITSMES